jgi:DNA-binding NarL/FixJ family response regulator
VAEPAIPLRILLADDHALVREGLRHLLQVEERLQVVGEATNGGEAIALARRLKPDVLVLDVSMPRMTGLEALRELSNGTVRRACRAIRTASPNGNARSSVVLSKD